MTEIASERLERTYLPLVGGVKYMLLEQIEKYDNNVKALYSDEIEIIPKTSEK